MELEKQMRGPVTVIALNGELDSTTAPRVQQGLDELVPVHGMVLLDLSRTTYMSSAGLRVLLLVYRLCQQMGTRVMVSGISDEVRAVMSATGFLAFFTVAGSVDEGVEVLAA
ncbi:MAG TPA: STAS domain-containing protein [Kutzneria sp.]|jgi:anti-anti-sigma factor